MINKKNDLVNKIEEKLIQWDTYIKLRGKSGRFDLHKDSENNIRDILNILYGYNLKDLNLEKPNFPVIDLGDIDRGICFQVTANKSDQSYYELESRFLNSKLNLKEKYPRLNVFILSGLIDNREGLLRALRKTGLTNDCLFDFKRILDEVRDLSNEENPKLDKVLQVLDKNYISYKYFDTAINNYKIANTGRFSRLNTFTEPHLIEENKNPFKSEAENNEDDRAEELRTFMELGKISFKQACEQSSQFILTGDAGSGKSEIMKSVFQKKLDEEKEYLPFYIDLSKGYKEKDISDLIHEELHNNIGEQDGISRNELAEALAKQLLSNNTLSLLFDSYDEMDKSLLDIWNERIRAFLALYPGVELIIAVRKNRILQDIVVPISKIYSILPFDNEQIEKYIELLLLENGQSKNEAKIRLIKNKVSQSKLFLTAPTLIVKMLIQYAAMQTGEEIIIPNTKASAYRNYFEHVIRKKIKTSGIANPETTIPDLMEKLMRESFKILSQIAFLNFKYHGQKTPKIDFTNLNTILDSIESKSKTSHLYQKGVNFFVNELQIIKFENEEYCFNHFTYEEFFFAIWLKDRLEKSLQVLRWIKSAYLVAEYNQVFAFLAGLMNETEQERFAGLFLSWPFRFWMRTIKFLDEITMTKFYFIAEMAVEGNVSKENTRILVDKLSEELHPRNEVNFEKTCRILSRLSPGSEIILKRIIGQFVVSNSWGRKQGLKHYVLPDIKRTPGFKNYIYELLNSENSYERDTAIEIFRTAGIFDDEVMKKILALHFREDNANENEGFRYMTQFSKKYPDKCVDYSYIHLKRIIDKKIPHHDTLSLFLRYYFAHVMHIPGYNEVEIEREVVDCLFQVDGEPRAQNALIRALYTTGIRNDTIISTLIEILNTNSPLATRIFMYFRDLFVVRYEIIELACRYLYSEDMEARRRAINYLAVIRYDGYFDRNGSKVRIAERALEIMSENRDQEYAKGGEDYALMYLANINYTGLNVTNIVIGLLNDHKHYLHKEAISYLMSTKYYSQSFFDLMCNSQDGLNYLWESNRYFDNIEKYIPKDKINDAKHNLMSFFIKKSWALWKILKKTKNANKGMAERNLKDYLRIALALQKIVLYEDEVKQLSKL